MQFLLFTSRLFQHNAASLLSSTKYCLATLVEWDCPFASQTMRFYSKKEGGSAEVVDMDDGLPKDYKLKTLKTGSRRLDTIVNRATGKSSSQVEKLILSGKVLVNEVVVTKKAYNVQKADVVDVWNCAFEENADLALVDRVQIVDYALTASGYDIHVKSWKKFLVENWRHSA
ncbi:hypothetical protein Tcan_00222 [Toxocara canis]|uniref:RNA-binding S4 domain-containing protein n=1 Tax=Toxocara canis TaxID=6265 RepID=A0A0B2UTQ1_TOXCA|nr:hypothetical protein Tcan_00222 [Toxocara canis]